MFLVVFPLLLVSRRVRRIETPLINEDSVFKVWEMDID